MGNLQNYKITHYLSPITHVKCGFKNTRFLKIVYHLFAIQLNFVRFF